MDNAEDIRCYRITRVRKDGSGSKVIRNHVSLREAQAYCKEPRHQKEGSWCCYDYMPKCKPKK